MSNVSTKFSVIIPTYNASRYIEECIESVLQQCYSNFEIILVDDGSSDSTVQICQNLLKNFENVLFIQQPNSGPNVARNMALSKANSDYVIFVDADDKIESNALSEFSSLIDEHNPDFINYGIDFFCSETGKIIKKTSSPTLILNDEHIFKHALKGKYILGVCWNKCIRLELLKDNNIFFTPDRNHGRDILFSRKCSFYSKKVLVSSKVLCHSRYHMDSFSRSFGDSNIISAIDLARHHIDFFASKVSNELQNLINYSIGRHFRYILILSAFRSECFAEFSKHLSIINSSNLGIHLTNVDNHFNLKDKLFLLSLKFPKLCWITAQLLKRLNFQPY